MNMKKGAYISFCIHSQFRTCVHFECALVSPLEVKIINQKQKTKDVDQSGRNA